MKRILIADDESNIRELLTELLSPVFEVIVAHDGRQALQRALESVPDLILMDVTMPGLKGTDVCEKLKAHPTTRTIPVVLLTAHGDISDRVLGLNKGADDYITKPFHPDELMARIEARLRALRLGEEAVVTTKVGNLSFDPVVREASVDGSEGVRLTQMEADLLVYFLSRAGRVIPRKQLLGDLWPDAVVSQRTVDTHIANLRRKLKGFDHVFESVHGTGYRLRSGE
jgi:DNA-binding response OmpR family regulator